jgi:hypothetical protein
MPKEKPPFLNTWVNIYLLVIGVLVVLILFLYFFTGYFR